MLGGSDKDKKTTDKEKEEKKDKKEVCSATFRHDLLQLNSIFTRFSSICLQKKKREKKKSNRVRRNLQYLDGQLSLFIGCTPPSHTQTQTTSVQLLQLVVPLCYKEKCLTNPDFVVCWSSILHLLPHRVLIPPAALPQSQKMR